MRMRVLFAFLVLLAIEPSAVAQAGSITISITTTTVQSGVAAGTITHTETFSDAGLVGRFGQWLLDSGYCKTGTPPINCTMSGANLNTAFQAWAAAFVQGTKNAVQQDNGAAAATTAKTGVAPVN